MLILLQGRALILQELGIYNFPSKVLNKAEKIAIPSSLCTILFLILTLLSKYSYISDIYRKVFGILLIPAAIVTVYSVLPCISYYFKMNKITGNENKISGKNYKIIYRLAIIVTLLVIFSFLSSQLNIISISKGIFYIVLFINVLLWIFISCIK